MVKSFLLVPVAALALSACSDTTLGSKSFTEEVDQLSIPGAPINIGLLDLPELTFDLDLQDDEEYTSLDFVTSVNLRSATFNISPNTDSPSLDQFADNNPDNFDFLSSLTLSLTGTIDGKQEKVRIGTLPEGDPQIGTNTTALTLTIDDVDVRDFVEAPDVQLVVEASGTVPPDFVIIDPVIRFRAGIGVR